MNSTSTKFASSAEFVETVWSRKSSTPGAARLIDQLEARLTSASYPRLGVHVWIGDAAHLLREEHDPKAVTAAISALLELHGWAIPTADVETAVRDARRAGA